MARRIDARILTPFGAASGMGNWRTASRYAQMLRASGINASIYEPKDIADACVSSGQRAVAVVLNGIRSHEEIKSFRAAGIPVLLVVTGTDLYGALKPSQQGSDRYRAAEESLHLSEIIVTLQSEAQREIQSRWPDLADRVHCIFQTSPARKPHAPQITANSKTVRFLIAAHIREEKDPRTAFLAFHHAFPEGWATRPDGGKVPARLIHVGSHQDRTLAQELINLGSKYPGILVEGALTHAQTMRQMTHVHALLQPSVSEGGALVVPEAIACRCPVIASAIPAHLGQLGPNYPGLFQVGDVEGLARLLTAFVADEGFNQKLRQTLGVLAPKLTSPAHERDELVRLVRRMADPGLKDF